jgi:hypothetical protein
MVDQREHREFQDNILAMQQESMAGLKRAIEQKNQIQEMFETEKRRRIDIERMYNDAIQEFYGSSTGRDQGSP